MDLVIKTKGGVLLSRRSISPYKNLWHMPGGRIRFKETLVQAIDRLAKTEVNLRVKPKKLLGYMEFLRERQNSQPRHTVSLVFLVEPLRPVGVVKEKLESVKVFRAKSLGIIPIHLKFLLENKILR